MYKRILNLQDAQKSFFLWGQRQTGKSSLLKNQFPNATYIDLLRSDEFVRFSSNPSLLRERILSKPKNDFVVIDEVQKIPKLLDEVHSLIESDKVKFALCGSSARKIKRGHGNLLGGRALKYELYGLSAHELLEDFDLVKMLNRGYLPSHYQDDRYFLSLESYVADYLKEEILSEGLTRNLPVFSRFLEVAAIGDTEVLNYSNVARETGVSVKTVQSYFDILVDTLTASYLPAYLKRIKRRTRQSHKFYFHDVGVANFLTRRKNIEPKTELFGKAFENWLLHELQSWISYSKTMTPIYYWALTTGVEVDFILGDMRIAIEAKASERVNSNHLKNLRELKKDFPNIKERYVVCMEKDLRKTEDGIWILPYQTFIKALWQNPLHLDTELSLEKYI